MLMLWNLNTQNGKISIYELFLIDAMLYAQCLSLLQESSHWIPGMCGDS